MGVYERLGIQRVINADATLTRLGGSLMEPEVLDAMRDAAGSFVDMHELQRVVGRRLAELTGNEAAYVATGAAAGIACTASSSDRSRRPYCSSIGRDTAWNMTGAKNACMASTGSTRRNRPASICRSR